MLQIKEYVLAAALVLSGSATAQPIEEAHLLYGEGSWQEAADAYQALVNEHPDDSAAWFGLGQSRHQLKNYAGAEEAYRNAEEKGFQPVQRVRYQLGRVYMSLGDDEKALQQIEAIGDVGGMGSQLLMATAEFEPLVERPRFMAVAEKLKPCNTERYRDFDFWLGQWDVTPAGRPAATARSSITSVQGGCAVLEEYRTQAGFSGMSINFYDSNTGLWHQSWMSSGGGAVHLQGKLIDSAMVLSDADLMVSDMTGTINRVSWSLLNDGRVRQHWEISTDGGETWVTSFDGYYASVNARSRAWGHGEN